jgi:hypothetical protein
VSHEIPDPPGEPVSPEEWERLWLAEADRRWAEIVEGKVETIPLEEVLRRARSASALGVDSKSGKR